MPAPTDEKPVAASDDERKALADIERLLQQGQRPGGELTVTLSDPNGEVIALPASAFTLLRPMIHFLALGEAVAVIPLSRNLTTQEAADLLNVSRPFLVSLLERGVIPFTMTGTHRRVRFSDLITYKQGRDAERRRDLAQLTQMSQELGLYNE